MDGRHWLLLFWPGLARAAGEGPKVEFGAQLVQVLGGLALVLALVGGLAWLARRLGAARFAGGGRLRLVAGLSLGARERLVVVQVGETQLVLGVAPGRVQTLHVLEKPLPEPEPAAPHPFAAGLAQVLGREERP